MRSAQHDGRYHRPLKLGELRLRAGLSQAELGRRLGIGQSSVSLRENRRELMVGTIADHVDAMGGEMRIVVDLTGPNGSCERYLLCVGDAGDTLIDTRAGS